jgi:hypothetical protein
LYPLQVDSKYDEPTCDEGSPRLRDYFAIMWSPSLSLSVVKDSPHVKPGSFLCSLREMRACCHQQ